MAQKDDDDRDDVSTVVLRRRLPCTPETAWEALTGSDSISKWWGTYVSLDARPGGAFREVWRDGGRDVVTSGTVVGFAPPRRLELTWKDDDWTVETRVTISLAEEGGSTALELVHEGWDRFPAEEGASLGRAHAAGWDHHLDSLSVYLGDRSP